MKKIYEGWHSYVYLTDRNTIIKRFKEGLIKNYEKEKLFLNKLQRFGFVPKIISYDDNKLEIEMEYIDGMYFIDFLLMKDKEEIRNILKKIIKICYILDRLRIEKEEFTRPYKHIIIKDGKIYLIDWERARIKERPSNLTQFMSFMINSDIIRYKGIIFEKDLVINLMKEYKRKYSKEILKKLIKIL